MANDQATVRDKDTAARAASGEPAPAQTRQPPPAHALGLETPEAKAAKEAPGFNPYDTTGGFDRKKNWAQVRRR